MINKLRIQNFKCWKDTGEIEMSPITLLFGTNSSGKSSIGQFLMMLKQTVESPDRKAVFFPGGRNSPVQLGSFQEMVYGRKADEKISFNYEWDLPENLGIKDPISKAMFSGDKIGYKAQVGLYGNGEKVLAVDSLEYKVQFKDNMELTVRMERNRDGINEYSVKSTKYPLRRKVGRKWSPGAPVRFYGFPDEVVAYHQNADFVQELNLRHERLFSSIHYLGPLRNRAERLYTWGGNQPESVGYSGENTVAAILAARKENRKINLEYDKNRKLFEELIAEKLKQMELIEEFKLKQIADQRQEYEVKIRTKGSPDWVDLLDVGFGISQILPVLVECYYAPRNSIIIIEQPEIHLHPKAQTLLADVMIDVINAREDGQERNIQLIIESHSEHFLRRLQRRIAEDRKGDLTNKITAYFAEITIMPAKLLPLQIDSYGNILNWPENFFGDEMGDIAAQAKVGLERKIAEKGPDKEYSAK